MALINAAEAEFGYAVVGMDAEIVIRISAIIAPIAARRWTLDRRMTKMLEYKTVSMCGSSDYCRGWNDAVAEMPKWISVKERMPET